MFSKYGGGHRAFGETCTIDKKSQRGWCLAIDWLPFQLAEKLTRPVIFFLSVLLFPAWLFLVPKQLAWKIFNFLGELHSLIDFFQLASGTKRALLAFTLRAIKRGLNGSAGEEEGGLQLEEQVSRP